MSSDNGNPLGLDGTPNASPTFKDAASGLEPVTTPPPVIEVSDGPKNPVPSLKPSGSLANVVDKTVALEDFEKKHANDMLRLYNEAHNSQKTVELSRDFDKAR